MTRVPQSTAREDERFVLETDQAPEFWQFVNGLRGDDLLVELIVNELDAKSSHTTVEFGPDRLVCSGNGDAIDADGWARLRRIKGAGHAVKAKIGMFGVKNHGLKACFTIGNDILLRSAGKQILQTLFADGSRKPPFPGVRVPERDDPAAPAHGTVIEVPYRRRAFTVPHGEAIAFAAVDDEQIAAMFEDAVAHLPKRLMGVIRPGALSRYTLELRHHRLGTRVFTFGAGRTRCSGDLVTFFRDCREGERTIAREQACLVVSGLRSSSKPAFFQAEDYRVGGKPLFARHGLIVEVAWDVDADGRVAGGAGKLRYPIAYPENGGTGTAGGAYHISGPFVSGTERHGLAAQSSDWNDRIAAAADRLATRVVGELLIPRFGARALTLIADLPAERLQPATERLLKARVLPVVDADERPITGRHPGRIAVPTYTALPYAWAGALARVVPPGMSIIDPATPPPLLRLLASGLCAGWGKDHRRFDEGDVLERLRVIEAEHYPWASKAERATVLGDPARAAAHLDALLPSLERLPTKSRPAGEDAWLPDTSGTLHALGELRRGASVPAGLVGLDTPPVVHPALRAHSVFKLDGWKLARFALIDLLRGGSLDASTPAVRRRFFAWLSTQPDEIGRDDWPVLRALPIWPATDGTLRRFDELCLPDPAVSKLLGPHIARPARDVRTLCHDDRIRRGRLVLRTEPDPAEIRRFYEAGIAGFPVDRVLDQDERRRFHRFEQALLTLGRSRRIERLLRTLRADAVALSRAGRLRPVTMLAREDGATARIALLADDLLDRPTSDLDRILPPARIVSPAAAIAALRADPADDAALLPRLAAITATADPAIRAELEALPCIPVDGRLMPPNRLAFRGNKGEFWTGWRHVLGGEGLSDLAQDLYRDAGVIRSLPSPQTSRAYFEWLETRSGPLDGEQLSCVFRHILHRQGVAGWLFQPPEVPSIPVEGDGAAELLTLGAALKVAVIDDVPELGDAIRDDPNTARIRLAIDSVRVPNQPIGDNLAAWGIPTLSSLTKDPGSPAGGRPAEAPALLQTVRTLTAPAAARRFRKQVKAFDIKQAAIEPQFQRRLAAIERVMLADDLTVQYRARGRLYRATRPFVVLPNAIWIDRAGDTGDLLMKAIAELVFVKPRPRYLAAVLKEALRHRVREFDPRSEAGSADPDDDEDGGDDRDSGTGESDQHHPGGEPDPARNTPRPGKLFAGAGAQSRKGGGKQRVQVDTEEIQRKQLKLEHYASHCQLDLARHAPESLAPKGSYAEHGENRVRVMQAHHPDKVSAGGPRHAGNLLILSKVNHDLLGTRLSRADITAALRERWSPKTIRVGGELWLAGGIARAIDGISGDEFPLFFTDDHRDYWLAMA
ncbi:hypothetical protein D9601_16865 [Sphingomonas sp. MA1305]|uniref:hypothetical protein n=1 Tax=Sphingomonas sp. MA1305 TaxID=2479204 RepID=UPI0018DF010C|nr:hypothetical protein [Sphingomonas sp. MA1305]MBI0477025.1 hypothetical protein [Sphingomonas sp. MA1305]